MTRVDIRTRYHAHGAWIVESSLGSMFHLKRRGIDVVIQLPASPDDFSSLKPTSDVVVPIPACHVAAQLNVAPPGERAIAINLIVVTLGVPGNALLQLDRHSQDQFAEAQRLWDQWGPLSNGIAYEFLSWIRSISRQDWIGLVTHTAIPFGTTGFCDAASGEDILGVGPTITQSHRPSQLALNADELRYCVNRLRAGAEIDFAAALMADAAYLVVNPTGPDSDRAVLSVAIAAELRTKSVMRSQIAVAVDENAAISIESVSKLGLLLDFTMLNTFGFSLKKDDRELYNSMARLGRKRDRLVHRGEHASVAEAKAWLRSTDSAFAWLRERFKLPSNPDPRRSEWVRLP